MLVRFAFDILVCHDVFMRIKTMARNLEVSIRIEMNETDAPLSANSEEAEAISSGHFRLVLDGAKSLNIMRSKTAC